MRTLLLILITCVIAFGRPVTLGISEFEPNIIYKRDTIVGYDIDIWNEIAKRGKIDFEFKKYDKFDNLISDVSSGSIEAGMSGITITSDRESEFDFSYPYMRSNLAVLKKSKGIDIFGVLLLFVKESWGALVFFLGYVLVFALLIYGAEYGKDSFSDKFLKGMGDGIYFVNTTTTSTGYGDKTPITPLGKAISMVIMWVGIGIIFPYITGQMSNIITTYNNTDRVADFDDLYGKKVAVVKHTTSEQLMIDNEIDYEGMNNVDRCLRLLENNEVDVVVYDESLLRYVDKVNQYEIQPLRPIIQNYGIDLKENSRLKDKIDVIILEIMEDGTYQKIHDKWFSEK